MATQPDKALFKTYAHTERKSERVAIFHGLKRLTEKIKTYEDLVTEINRLFDEACADMAEEEND